MSSFQIGISAVPAALVMDMLPAGVMQHTFDITIQAPGVAVFTTPVQMTMPNISDARQSHWDFRSLITRPAAW